jgi:MFS family permease
MSLSKSDSLKTEKLDSSSKKLLSLLFAGVLMGALDIAVIGPALPAIKTAFNISTRDASWIFNIYLLLHLVSVPLMAKLSDTYGRRNIYIIDVLLFAIGSIIIVFSWNFESLLVGRAIQGFGAGGIFPVASAVIGDTFPKEKQGSALGMIGAVFGLAFILGPIIGGVLLLFSWHLIFAINIPISIGVIFFAFKLLPKKKVSVIKEFDFTGLLLLTSILSGFSYGVNRIDTKDFLQSILDLHVFPFLLIPIILIPFFFKTEKKAVNPIINLSLLKSKQLIVTYIVAFGAGISETSAMFMPAMAKELFQLSNSKASFMLIPMVLTMFVGAPTAGKVIDKYGPKIAIQGGTLVLTIGLIILAALSHTIAGFYAGGSLIGFGLAALLGAPLRYIINRECPGEIRASGQGIVTISTSSGQIIAAALIGALIASLGGTIAGFTLAFSTLSVISLLIFFVSFNLKKNEI